MCFYTKVLGANGFSWKSPFNPNYARYEKMLISKIVHLNKIYKFDFDFVETLTDNRARRASIAMRMAYSLRSIEP